MLRTVTFTVLIAAMLSSALPEMLPRQPDLSVQAGLSFYTEYLEDLWPTIASSEPVDTLVLGDSRAIRVDAPPHGTFLNAAFPGAEFHEIEEVAHYLPSAGQIVLFVNTPRLDQGWIQASKPPPDRQAYGRQELGNALEIAWGQVSSASGLDSNGTLQDLDRQAHWSEQWRRHAPEEKMREDGLGYFFGDAPELSPQRWNELQSLIQYLTGKCEKIILVHAGFSDRHWAVMSPEFQEFHAATWRQVESTWPYVIDLDKWLSDEAYMDSHHIMTSASPQVWEAIRASDSLEPPSE